MICYSHQVDDPRVSLATYAAPTLLSAKSHTLNNTSRKQVYLCRPERRYGMRERMAARSRRTLCTADKLAAGVWRFNDSSPSPLPHALAVQAFTSPIFTGCMPADQRSGLQCLINTGISPIIRATASTSKMEIRVNRERELGFQLSALSLQLAATRFERRAGSRTCGSLVSIAPSGGGIPPSVREREAGRFQARSIPGWTEASFAGAEFAVGVSGCGTVSAHSPWSS